MIDGGDRQDRTEPEPAPEPEEHEDRDANMAQWPRPDEMPGGTRTGGTGADD